MIFRIRILPTGSVGKRIGDVSIILIFQRLDLDTMQSYTKLSTRPNANYLSTSATRSKPEQKKNVKHNVKKVQKLIEPDSRWKKLLLMIRICSLGPI